MRRLFFAALCCTMVVACSRDSLQNHSKKDRISVFVSGCGALTKAAPTTNSNITDHTLLINAIPHDSEVVRDLSNPYVLEGFGEYKDFIIYERGVDEKFVEVDEWIIPEDDPRMESLYYLNYADATYYNNQWLFGYPRKGADDEDHYYWPGDGSHLDFWAVCGDGGRGDIAHQIAHAFSFDNSEGVVSRFFGFDPASEAYASCTAPALMFFFDNRSATVAYGDEIGEDNVNNDAINTVDLLIGLTPNRAKSQGPVPFNLKHVLSGVSVVLGDVPEDLNKETSIVSLSNVLDTRACIVGLEADPIVAWFDNIPEEDEMDKLVSTYSQVAPSVSPIVNFSDEKTFWLIPQKRQVTLALSYVQGSKPMLTKSVKLNVDWKPGYYYTYKISLGSGEDDEIVISDVTVTPMQDGGTTDINM